MTDNDEPCMCGTPWTCMADEHDGAISEYEAFRINARLREQPAASTDRDLALAPFYDKGCDLPSAVVTETNTTGRDERVIRP